jgi:hypothetical protein
VLSAAVSLAGILGAAPALAAAQPVQVLAVQSDDAVDQAQAMTSALKDAALHQSSIKLVPGDYSLEVLSLALSCPDTPDDACLAKIAGKIKADAFVWGTLSKDGKKLDLKLNLYRRGQTSRSSEVRYSPSLENEELKDIASGTLSQLFSQKRSSARAEPEEETGKLLLSADDLNGQIVIDGAPAGEIRDGHAQLELPVGEHDISVRTDGYLDAEGTVTISHDKRALLRLHPRKLGVTRASHDDSNSDSSDAQSNAGAGWGAIIVGGAFVAAGVYSTLRVNSINHDSEFDSYRAGIAKNDDACVEANRNLVVTGATAPSRISELCSQSKTFEALQYVFFGLGAVAAGTGALILLTDDKSAPPKSDAHAAPLRRKLAIVPRLSVGPHSAAIDLRFCF